MSALERVDEFRGARERGVAAARLLTYEQVFARDLEGRLVVRESPVMAIPQTHPGMRVGSANTRSAAAREAHPISQNSRPECAPTAPGRVDRLLHTVEKHPI